MNPVLAACAASFLQCLGGHGRPVADVGADEVIDMYEFAMEIGPHGPFAIVCDRVHRRVDVKVYDVRGDLLRATEFNGEGFATWWDMLSLVSGDFAYALDGGFVTTTKHGICAEVWLLPSPGPLR